MKQSDNTKKNDNPKLTPIHIRSDIHRKLKIYCVTKRTTIADFATKVISDSIKDFKVL